MRSPGLLLDQPARWPGLSAVADPAGDVARVEIKVIVAPQHHSSQILAECGIALSDDQWSKTHTSLTFFTTGRRP